MKTLIVYFSRTGEQYSVGNITKGNTAIVAEMIARETNGDLFEVKLQSDTYPAGYTELTQVAKQEKSQNMCGLQYKKIFTMSKTLTTMTSFSSAPLFGGQICLWHSILLLKNMTGLAKPSFRS